MKLAGKIKLILLLFSGLSITGRSQTCGVWEVTNTAELLAAVTAACGSGGGVIKMQSATYTISDPITLCGNLTLEGGYNAGFLTKSNTSTTTISRNTLNPQGAANQQRLVAVFGSSISSFRLQDLTITVSNAIGNGMSTYAFYCSGCSNYDIVRTTMVSGNGTVGTNGSVGGGGSNGGTGGRGSGGNNDNQSTVGSGGGGA
ncbi:MAG: hypothetical protein JKX73_09930, partial [Flavobacteriales bacterium]|nr:hypothetical protein [Flavobacteriales bacterium]